MNARMGEKERMLWEQAVRVLEQNSVTSIISVDPLEAQRILAKARKRAVRQRRT